ncbi:MAG: hypothetical protein ACPGJS_20790 [Flammeovirgaceae bacterium]
MAKESVKKAWTKPEMNEYSQKIIQSGSKTTIPESIAIAMADYQP